MSEESSQPDELKGYCLDCRYPLRGLTNHVCPKCGRAFDPKDPMTFSPTAKRWSWAVPVDGFCAVVFSLPMGYLLLEVWMGSGRFWWWRGDLNFVAWVLMTIGVVVWIAFRLFSQQLRSLSDAAWAGFAGLDLLLALVMGEKGITLYSLSMSFALCLVLSWRAWRTTAWKSRQLAMLAMLVNALGMLALLSHVPLHRADIFDYWTYWFWTNQRY